ncbi:aldo/keto reductase [Actinacidiphila bryophytorum]|uniref:L-galactose dehydrogenase n=1 Tax=Actinacidiphila bryophytorum TaxID=1436133 RepID=A0A9W4GY46_9ACTN|nr:aldo/keto reductase [Actinacidiphila bryophytorum]MBM9440755.1 aldo/keto reductase [Actinacidiphila bryophytorum]MBN6544000.1 aldo/keto reductase [Actinacidiphila bryophytorum]CAG7612761.1 L-galactose dehydrogenase [Actinacidiphila bryophytorum]
MKRRPLGSTGLDVSELGFGASPLGAVYGAFAEPDGIDAVHAALDLGICFFDVSPYYGATLAETVLGKALRGVERSGYVLATKVGRYGDDEFDFTAERVERSVHESLERLRTDHLDLVQCHDVEFGDLGQVVHETLPALRRLQDAGLVRAVGVTGYPLGALHHVADRGAVDTVMSYCQYTLQNRRLARRRPDFERAGAAVVNAAPLAMGALTGRGPAPWHPAPAAVLERCAAAAALCRARGADIARLAVQFAVSTGGFASTVVGTSSAREVRRLAEWTAQPLDEELLRAVEECLAPVLDRGWANGRPENQYSEEQP